MTPPLQVLPGEDLGEIVIAPAGIISANLRPPVVDRASAVIIQVDARTIQSLFQLIVFWRRQCTGRAGYPAYERKDLGIVLTGGELLPRKVHRPFATTRRGTKRKHRIAIYAGWILCILPIGWFVRIIHSRNRSDL
jgi:hypothetical protein